MCRYLDEIFLLLGAAAVPLALLEIAFSAAGIEDLWWLVISGAFKVRAIDAIEAIASSASEA